MLVGYARTSTAEQIAGLDAQERDLKAAGAEEVFREQVSSVGTRVALATGRNGQQTRCSHLAHSLR